jgi:LmbE family N-acetylglucosaminyl deacetylase
MRRLLVISPHLGDGVFSCGQLLAAHPGSAVLTVFAGRPSTYSGLTEWDAASGFTTNDDPVETRRAEDRAALRFLDAEPIWLDFVDSQYGPSPKPRMIAPALESAIVEAAADRVCIPLGLPHGDHELVYAAAVMLMHRRPHNRLVCVRGYDPPRQPRTRGTKARLPGGTSGGSIAGARGMGARRCAQACRDTTIPLATPCAFPFRATC